MTGGNDGDPIATFLTAACASGRTSGAAWFIGDPGGRAASRGAAGLAVAEPRREEAGEDTPFDLASLTKPLATALLAASLFEEGRLDLDEPAGELLTELEGSPWAGVSWRRLGEHRSGLPAWEPLSAHATDLSGALRRIAALAPAARPGEVLYSDLGYVLLGAGIERAAGAPLDELFLTKIARPLGLRATGFARRPATVPHAAATERGNAYERALAGPAGGRVAWRTRVIRGEVHDANAWALGGVAGHAGLFGTAWEVETIGRQMLSPGRLALGARARAALLEPADPDGRRTFGFQCARDAEAVRGVLPDDAVGHLGFTGTSVWIDPRSGRICVLLANRVHPRVPDEPFTDVRREFHRLAFAARPGRSP